MTTAEAVQHIARRSIVTASMRRGGLDDAAIMFVAIRKLEHALRSWSPLAAEGFLPGAAVAEKLPPDYWREVQLDRVDHLRPGGASRSRTEKSRHGRREAVENVTVSAWMVYLRWPAWRWRR